MSSISMLCKPHARTTLPHLISKLRQSQTSLLLPLSKPRNPAEDRRVQVISSLRSDQNRRSGQTGHLSA
uniref:Uncharacterized protein n=1 Tax=Arundo donax TaxID=35708 RepID=A0A0A9EY26_ARUDO